MKFRGKSKFKKVTFTQTLKKLFPIQKFSNPPKRSSSSLSSLTRFQSETFQHTKTSWKGDQKELKLWLFTNQINMNPPISYSKLWISPGLKRRSTFRRSYWDKIPNFSCLWKRIQKFKFSIFPPSEKECCVEKSPRYLKHLHHLRYNLGYFLNPFLLLHKPEEYPPEVSTLGLDIIVIKRSQNLNNSPILK